MCSWSGRGRRRRRGHGGGGGRQERAAVEKYGFAAGAAVAGMSGTVCGLYLANGAGSSPEQVVCGFTERFRHGLAERGGLTPPQRYGKTWTSAHDPLVWRETADALLAAAGVRVLFHTSVVGVVMDGDAYRGVVLSSNAGTCVVHAARTIDALRRRRAGGPRRRPAHLRRRRTDPEPHHVLPSRRRGHGAFLSGYGDDTISPPWVSERIRQARELGDDLPRDKIWIFTTPRPGELMVNATRLTARRRADAERDRPRRLHRRRDPRAAPGPGVRPLPRPRPSPAARTPTSSTPAWRPASGRPARSPAPQTLTNDDVVSGRKDPSGISAQPLADRTARRRPAQAALARRRLLRGPLPHPGPRGRRERHRRRALPERPARSARLGPGHRPMLRVRPRRRGGHCPVPRRGHTVPPRRRRAGPIHHETERKRAVTTNEPEDPATQQLHPRHLALGGAPGAVERHGHQRWRTRRSPKIAIVNTSSKLSVCFIHLDDVADMRRRGRPRGGRAAVRDPHHRTQRLRHQRRP